MKEVLIVFAAIVGMITAEYVGPQNGHRNGNGNGNGNAYGVPTDSFVPPPAQGPSGPYPPSGWKPAGRRLLLPGESRSAQQPIDSGYGQPPPSQYGPSVDNTAPTNQYIPGTAPDAGFGNGGNGNGQNGNGHNGVGNGNGNGHNGNGNGNGNGHNGNGFSNGNGNGNGNGHNGVNGGNGNGNGNGHNGNGNGNGFSNGNGNGHNGNGNGNGNGKGGNGSNGLTPSFFASYPSQGIYPFVQLSVPATIAAFRPSNGAGTGIYPVFQVPHSSFPTGLGAGSGVVPLSGAFPSFAAGGAEVGSVPVANGHDLSGTYPAVLQGGGLAGNGLAQYYTLLSNGHSHKSNLLGSKNGLSQLQVQYAFSQPTHGHGGVPLGFF